MRGAAATPALIQIAPRGAPRDFLLKYLWSLGVVAVATAVRYFAQPVVGDAGFAITLVSLLVAAWVGGLPASLVAQTALLFVEGTLFPDESPGPEKSYTHALLSIGAYYSVGIFVALLSELVHVAKARANFKHQETLAERERLKASLACMGDAVMLTDEDGRVTLINSVAENMLGMPGRQVLGQPLELFVTFEDGGTRQPVPNIVRRVLGEKKEIHSDRPVWLKGPHGGTIPVKFSAAPIRDGTGLIAGIVLVIHDETERLKSEQALRDADRRKDEFLATLAHELRNPLAPITTGLQLMALAMDNRELLEETRLTMERQTRHMVRLIDDLLDVSRITRGKLTLQREIVPIQQVVQHALDAMKAPLELGRKRLSVSLPPEPCLVDGDPHRLTQVITNLLDNAVKFTPPQGEISVALVRNNGHVSITISDSGVGIPEAMRQQIFEMFTQVDRHAAGTTGLGIGLTLVKSVVEMHGGSVRVFSAGENQGSRFIVDLPAAPTNRPPEAAPKPTAERPDCGPPLRVLVVDDNADALQTLSRLVRRFGHDVATAEDGEAAVELARSYLPEIILMDIGMPKLNGHQAAEIIRSESWSADVVLVATTGWGQDSDRQKSQESGFHHHLVKPVHIESLRSILRSKQALTAN